jgi:hypothetical protein
VADFARARRYLAERHRRQRETRARALARFLGRGPVDLADLGPLSAEELEALLALLSRLLAVPPREGVRESRSADGRLRLYLEEPGPGAWATLEAPAGRLTLPAYRLTVEDAAAPARPREALMEAAIG